ncbi:F-box protein SKIP19-like [Silene latifolia]|uniref:F-box protein SKIP19-like n=1 Tax=Silene latifolia TaxID=37657 RepID=UPI003D774818
MACDDEALAIAGNMPELRCLQLIGNGLTDVGLTTILDGCPRLESLDLRACFHIELEGNLGNRLLEQIKDLCNKITPMENPDPPVEEVRNWLELPCDLMLMILMKVGPFDILESAQFVCKVWYTLCIEPVLWRTIHIQNVKDPHMVLKYEKMMFNAVNRSAGGLIDVSIEGFGSDQLCSYIASQSRQLKRLRLANCDTILSENVFVKALEKLSSLEELELTLWDFEYAEPISVIKSCHSLITTFKFNNLCSTSPYQPSDNEALAIAASMPQLRHLQLIGNNMTNVGLTAILDSCPRLQSLDLRACYYLDLEEDLGKRLSEQIKDLRHPYDSTEDYNFPTTDNDPYDYWQYDSNHNDYSATEPDYIDDNDYDYWPC